MKIKNLFAFAIALIVFTHAQVSVAQANKSVDGWWLLGARTVDYTLDRDVVSVEDSKTTFTSLKFIVKNGTLNMHKGTVHFKNGDTQDIEFSEAMNKTNDGRLMNLKGNSRPIEKVTFWYDTKNSSDKKSIVEIWGKK